MGRDLSSGRRKDGRTDDDHEGMIETIYLGELGWPGNGAEDEGRTEGTSRRLKNCVICQ